jgi:integrase
MGTQKETDFKSRLKSGEAKRYGYGGGLYLCVTGVDEGYWALRYSLHGKRKLFTIGSTEYFTLTEARIEAGMLRAKIKKEGFDPVEDRHREALNTIRTVNDLFDDWYRDYCIHVKNPSIPRRKYERDVKKFLGGLGLDKVTPMDIRSVLRRIAESGRPTVANDVLYLMKMLFNHGMKLGVLSNNPALPFTAKDAGGVERSRDRVLSVDEISEIFCLMREHKTMFTRDNYLACALLLALGVRKMELLAARWTEFDLDGGLWVLPEERSKTKVSFTIPLPITAVRWLQELLVRSCGSDYIFPQRRSSKRYQHVGPDTLNAALNKLIRQHGIGHFTVHDFRRTFRSLLAGVGTPPHVAERCLNHKVAGVEGIYDRYDYLAERRIAMGRVLARIEGLIVG